MELREQVLRIFPMNIRDSLLAAGLSVEKLCEIRIRAGKPVCFRYSDFDLFLDYKDRLTKNPFDAVTIGENSINTILELICNYSLYAYSEEIKCGFITIQGGHRIGICGSVIMDNGKVSAIKHVSSLNVRIAHEVKGCSEGLLDYLYDNDVLQNTFIISPCGRGKTTILRDIIRQLSNGSQSRKGINVSVIDERSELGACYKGIAQNDLGIRTDILDGCKKQTGMMMLIRSMSPDVLALDEIGDMGELEAYRMAVTCGIKVIATVHGFDFSDIRNKPLFNRLIHEGAVKRFIFLKPSGNPGQPDRVCNERGEIIKEWQ